MGYGANQYIGLDVHLASNGIVSKKSGGERVGDEGESERITQNLIDREAHAINSHASLGDNVAQHLRRSLDEKVTTHGVFLNFRESSNSINMTLHDMPLKAILKSHGGLHVDPAMVVLGGDFAACLFAQFHLKTPIKKRDDCEARAINRDAVADLWCMVGANFE